MPCTNSAVAVFVLMLTNGLVPVQSDFLLTSPLRFRAKNPRSRGARNPGRLRLDGGNPCALRHTSVSNGGHIPDFAIHAVDQSRACTVQKRRPDDGPRSHCFDRLSFGYDRHRGVNKVTAMSKPLPRANSAVAVDIFMPGGEGIVDQAKHTIRLGD